MESMIFNRSAGSKRALHANPGNKIIVLVGQLEFALNSSTMTPFAACEIVTGWFSLAATRNKPLDRVANHMAIQLNLAGFFEISGII
jgi:hypothetical protein